MSRTGPFFGELYYRSTLPFFDSATTSAEVGYLENVFARRPGALLDLGCGHGRHASVLAQRSSRTVIGVDFDPLALGEALPGFLRVRGDLLALPFRDDSVGDAYAWYSTLFGMARELHVPMLKQVHRVLAPDARLVLQTIPVERLLDQPTATYDGELPDGSVLHEESRFDQKTFTDHGFRRLHMLDGRVLSAPYAIAYYPADELVQLLESTGFSVEWVHGALDASPLSPTSRDLILGAKKRHG